MKHSIIKEIKDKNYLTDFLYNSGSIHDKINYKSNHYYWHNGVAKKEFNKATRHYLNTTGLYEIDGNKVESIVDKLK